MTQPRQLSEADLDILRRIAAHHGPATSRPKSSTRIP